MVTLWEEEQAQPFLLLSALCHFCLVPTLRLIGHFSNLCVHVFSRTAGAAIWLSGGEGPRKVKSALWVSRWLTHS